MVRSQRPTNPSHRYRLEKVDHLRANTCTSNVIDDVGDVAVNTGAAPSMQLRYKIAVSHLNWDRNPPRGPFMRNSTFLILQLSCKQGLVLKELDDLRIDYVDSLVGLVRIDKVVRDLLVSGEFEGFNTTRAESAPVGDELLGNYVVRSNV